MFKRLFWLMVGVGFGFGTAVWVLRHLRATVDRYRPERVGADLAGALAGFGKDLRAAVAEGRLAMREREEALRADLASRPGVGGRTTSTLPHGGPG